MTIDPLWSPSDEQIASSNLTAFGTHAGQRADYPSLHRWSVRNPSDFWRAVWEWSGVIGEPGHRTVLEPPVGSDLPLIDTRFFPDASLSVVENLLGGGGAQPDDVAIVSHDESGRRRETTRSELAAQTAAMAAHLVSVGVGEGDRVAAWMPNTAETVVAMLASASIGAVFSSTSPDFGIDGVIDRFGQIEPAVLIAADGYRYGGKTIDCLGPLDAIVERLPSLVSVVVVPFLSGSLDPSALAATPGSPGRVDVTEVIGRESGVEARRFGFEHPWYILYSSGTTGVPKCIVHRTGLLLQHRKEHALNCNIARGDQVFYYTTCGWMMWNWLVSALGSGATIHCYDGSPFHPDPAALLRLAEAEGLTFMGISAKYIDSLRNEGYEPSSHHDLSALRTVASTGSPLVPESFEWFYERFAPHVHLASISGGTDLCSCFVLGDPTSPVFAGEIQRPGLGMDVGIADPSGREVPVGERGELVCRSAFPSTPIRFWNDPDRARLRSAYFGSDPTVWNHGDFASRTHNGGFIVHGRSDTTLNPGGVRIGTAEIYRRVEQLPEIAEALVFGQEHDGDVRIVLLVRMSGGAELTESMKAGIRTAIRTGCTPRHVPAVIDSVDDLPRTRSGKLAELAVADIVNGREVRNTSALANPETLATIRDQMRAHPSTRIALTRNAMNRNAVTPNAVTGAPIDRRRFMRAGLSGAGLVVALRTTGCVSPPSVPTDAFGQGVASGLHSEEAIVLWTRVEPAATAADSVAWAVSLTPDMTTVVASGSEPVLVDADHTVKVLVEGLEADRSYWYRFDADGALSPVGRARTLPPANGSPDSLRLAYASCQSFANGFYGAWRDVAARDIDAVVFLGDYIYEAPAIQLLSRVRPEQLVESTDLATYRSRYRQYKGDPDLQAAHAAHPWAVVWDDHEILNDWDRTTLTTHRRRSADAMRAWFEYQPIWPTGGSRIHRSLRWGRLGEIHLLDSRQYRDPGAESLLGVGFLGSDGAGPRRTMLGESQRAWLLDGLSGNQDDGVRWKIVGSPQPMGPMRLVDLDTPEARKLFPDLVEHAGFYVGLSGWDGFPVERDTILEHVRAGGIDNVAVLSGDVHSFWAGGLRADFDDPSSPIVAHDFSGGSISSSPGGLNSGALSGPDAPEHDWDFIDGTRNGYGLFECTPEGATVTFMGLDARFPNAVPTPIYSRRLPA